MNLKLRLSKLKKSKRNAKLALLEIMKISSIDFSVEHAIYKLRKYGFPYFDAECAGLMSELCEEGFLIFNGFKPIKVNSNVVGYEKIYGIIKKEVVK